MRAFPKLNHLPQEKKKKRKKATTIKAVYLCVGNVALYPGHVNFFPLGTRQPLVLGSSRDEISLFTHKKGLRSCILLKLQATTVDSNKEEVDTEAPPTADNIALLSSEHTTTLGQESFTSREPAAEARHESSEAVSANLERNGSQESQVYDKREDEKDVMLHNDLGSSNYELTQF